MLVCVKVSNVLIRVDGGKLFRTLSTRFLFAGINGKSKHSACSCGIPGGSACFCLLKRQNSNPNHFPPLLNYRKIVKKRDVSYKAIYVDNTDFNGELINMFLHCI